MPRPPRPPGSGPSLRQALVGILLAVQIVAAAQQQHPQFGHGSPHEAPSADTFIAKHHSKLAKAGISSTHRHGKDTAIADNERAIATLAPADSEAAVRAPLSAGPTRPSGGLPRRPARSLQDWEVEDFVLLATVDGTLYARDRKSGKSRWELQFERPMIETIYHRRNRSENDQHEVHDNAIWIVEPSQDGALYFYSPGPGLGMQRLGITVKQLVEQLSPYGGDDDSSPIVYTGEKRNTLYTVDAATGTILKAFHSGGASVLDDRRCKRVNGLEALDTQECEPLGVITLGRTEYTVGISDKATGEIICTIKYFEWVPNIRDRDLHSQYSQTLDNRYVYTRFDGTIQAMNYGDSGSQLPETDRFSWQQKLSSPVVRVFDVVRPYNDESDETNPGDTSLVILPQPAQPASSDDAMLQNVFVNCTETGSWFAMSEYNYPSVTDGALQAECYKGTWNEDILSYWTSMQDLGKALVGIHTLNAGAERRDGPFFISGPDTPLLDAPGEDSSRGNENVGFVPDISSPQHPLLSFFASLLSLRAVEALLVTILAIYLLQRWIPGASRLFPDGRKMELDAASLNAISSENSKANQLAKSSPELPVKERTVRFAEPEEIREDRTSGELTRINSAEGTLQEAVSGQGAEALPETTQQSNVDGGADQPKPKKKAHRGQRGGRNKKKGKRGDSMKEDEENVNRLMEDVKVLEDNDFGRVLGISDTSGTIQIGSISVSTDRVLGSGSGGTFVFEGTFQGREVAVKRMLPQYYELAEQEVSLLQQSDDHRNVIRYFAQEKDENFLYIAVELCQASLFDLFREDKTELCDSHTELINEILRDPAKALEQLARGLNHLHSLRIIHRDVKPQNILVAYPKKTSKSDGAVLKISDFGLCKTLPEDVSTLMATTGNNAGTVGWKAPELITQPKDADAKSSSNGNASRDSSSSSDQGANQGVKRAVDIFSLGCVFYYVLSQGGHPFDDEEGWMQLRELNIKKNKHRIDKLRFGADSEEPVHLVSWMLDMKPERRPTALQVLQHPFFWKKEDRLSFLCDVSDHFEHEPRDPPSHDLHVLEHYAPMVLEDMFLKGGFLHKLDRKFIDTLGKQRKYTGDSLLDLLRALRNKRNHWEDMPDDAKHLVGGLPDEYLDYWTVKFPKLLMTCYDVVVECGLENLPRFRKYFNLPPSAA